MMVFDCDSAMSGYQEIILDYSRKDSIYVNNEKMYVEKIANQRNAIDRQKKTNNILKVVTVTEALLLVMAILLK